MKKTIRKKRRTPLLSSFRRCHLAVTLVKVGLGHGVGHAGVLDGGTQIQEVLVARLRHAMVLTHLDLLVV